MKEGFNNERGGETHEVNIPTFKKKILSGKIGKIAQGAALLGALSVGGDSVVSSPSSTDLNKKDGPRIEMVEQNNREKTLISWLHEFGYEDVSIERDYRASGISGEAYEVTADGQSFRVSKREGAFTKDDFRKAVHERSIRMEFQRHIIVDDDAREIMDNIGVELEGNILVLKWGSRPDKYDHYDLYSDGENESVRIRKVGPFQLEVVFVEKGGKELRYELMRGKFELIQEKQN